MTASEEASLNGNAVPPSMDEIEGPVCWKRIVINWGDISQLLAIGMIFLFLWGIGLSILPDQTAPSATFMRLIFLFVGAKITGIVFELIGIPDLLGMTFFGVFYRNVGIGEFEGYEPAESFLRDIALVNIMLLAGLGLNVHELHRVLGIIAKMSFIPTIAEVGVITVVGVYLMHLPWLWSALLGLVITAVSPNVVISILLELKQKRLGMTRGIHTVIIGMTGLNDVLSIFFFGVIIGTIFSTGTLSETVLQGPIGMVLGLVFGGLVGYMILYLPSIRAVYCDALKFGLTLTGGLAAVLGSKYLGYQCGGALGCMTLAFVIGNKNYVQGRIVPENKVGMYLDTMWKFMKPISFALIGKELNFSVLDGTTVWQGLVVLLVGLVARMVLGYLCTSGGEFSVKERAYITLSSLPKATVQATIGPIALDMARVKDDEEDIGYAKSVLVCSVIAIMVTAPLFAFLMQWLAPRWLKKEEDEVAGQTNMAYA